MPKGRELEIKECNSGYACDVDGDSDTPWCSYSAKNPPVITTFFPLVSHLLAKNYDFDAGLIEEFADFLPFCSIVGAQYNFDRNEMKKRKRRHDCKKRKKKKKKQKPESSTLDTRFGPEMVLLPHQLYVKGYDDAEVQINTWTHLADKVLDVDKETFLMKLKIASKMTTATADFSTSHCASWWKNETHLFRLEESDSKRRDTNEHNLHCYNIGARIVLFVHSNSYYDGKADYEDYDHIDVYRCPLTSQVIESLNSGLAAVLGGVAESTIIPKRSMYDVLKEHAYRAGHSWDFKCIFSATVNFSGSKAETRLY